MNKNNKNKDKNKSEKNQSSSNEDIPLWLQGLEDQDNPNDISPNSEDLAEDLEISDLSQIDGNQVEEDTTDNPSIEDDSHETLGWVNELNIQDEDFDPFQLVNDDSNEGLEPHSSEDESSMEQSQGDTQDLDQEEAIVSDLSEEDIEEVPTEQGFIEISEIDLEDSKDDEFLIDEDDINEDKDIPDWLQEMITEPEDGIREDTEPVFLDQSIAETADIEKPEQESEILHQDISETDGTEWVHEPISEEEAVLQPDQELETPIEFEDQPQEEQLEEQHLVDSNEPGMTLETSEIQPIEEISDAHQIKSSQEDTAPIPVRDIPPTPIITSQETEEIFIPNILSQANRLLKEGKVDLAMETFNVYIEESAYLELIKGWIQDKINADNRNAGLLSEALGYIDRKQNDPGNSSEAYSDAINDLLQSEKDNDGFD
jgi:hypothetical protein